MDVDRFVRLHYFAFTSMLILLGVAASAAQPGDAWRIGALLLIGASFHIHGYVMNDVIDLDLDKTQARRARDPLVRGAISKRAASVFALVQLPLAALLCWRMRVGTQAGAVLVAAFAMAVVYNVWGKRCPIPPLTDLVQGLSWAALAAFAALAVEPLALRDPVRGQIVPIVAHGAGFILLINGIHGGLRDLATDGAMGMRTSALFFGARAESSGSRTESVSSLGVMLFAFGVHTAMYLPSFGFLWRYPDLYVPAARAAAAVLLVGLFLISCYALWRVVRRREPERGWWVSTHLFLLLLPPLVLYLPTKLVSPGFGMLVLCGVVVPLSLQVGVLDRVIRRIDRVGAGTLI
jgi:4-hydroxybenzoate polyprenyltransferase